MTVLNKLIPNAAYIQRSKIIRAMILVICGRMLSKVSMIRRIWTEALTRRRILMMRKPLMTDVAELKF